MLGSWEGFGSLTFGPGPSLEGCMGAWYSTIGQDRVRGWGLCISFRGIFLLSLNSRFGNWDPGATACVRLLNVFCSAYVQGKWIIRNDRASFRSAVPLCKYTVMVSLLFHSLFWCSKLPGLVSVVRILCGSGFFSLSKFWHRARRWAG